MLTMKICLLVLALAGTTMPTKVTLEDISIDTPSSYDDSHRITSRSSPTYTPHNYVQSTSYQNLAALTQAALAHQGQGHHMASQSAYRLKQPLTPVYHATPLQPYGALLYTSAEYKDENSFVKPIVEKQREEYVSREYSRGQSSGFGGSRGSGGAVGKLTEAIIHKPSITKHSPVVYQSLGSDRMAAEYAHEQKDDDHSDYAAKYQFAYQVRDPKGGNYFGHSETRDGHSTKGHYHVFLPDGRLQNVQYWTDRNGYHAQISYERPETSHQ